MEPTFNKEEYYASIREYYLKSENAYRKGWDLNRSLALHYGYWDETTSNLRDSLQNMNRQLATRASIKSSDIVLDMGCGVGGSAIFLVKEIGCHVTGITLLDRQIELAHKFAKEHGVTQKTAFYNQDFLETSFPAESFDVIWALESMGHTHDRKKFLKEVNRLLKPGGKFVFGDFFVKPENIQHEYEEITSKCLSGWAATTLLSKKEMLQLMHESPLEITEDHDATPFIYRSSNRLYWLGKVSLAITKTLRYLGIKRENDEINFKNAYTAYYQKIILDKNIWEYTILTAKKIGSHT